MNSKYTDLRIVAIIFCAVGMFSLVMAVISAFFNDSAIILVFGVIGSMVLYAIGGVLLLLIDIAKHVKVTAIIAIEEEKSQKAKPNTKPAKKVVGLQRIGIGKDQGVKYG